MQHEANTTLWILQGPRLKQCDEEHLTCDVAHSFLPVSDVQSLVFWKDGMRPILEPEITLKMNIDKAAFLEDTA